MTTAEEKTIKKGARGDDVRELQQKLAKLGYDLNADGIFGDATETAVRNLQKAFGYTVDGIVGKATRNLIEQQIGYKWNAKNPAGGGSAAAGKSP